MEFCHLLRELPLSFGGDGYLLGQQSDPVVNVIVTLGRHGVSS